MKKIEVIQNSCGYKQRIRLDKKKENISCNENFKLF